MMRMTNDVVRQYVAAAAAVIALAAIQVAPVQAQRPVSRNFEENAPAIGEIMPDVVVYDRDGTERQLRDLLTDRHAVLILGCLT